VDFNANYCNWISVSLIEYRLDGTFNNPHAVSARSKVLATGISKRLRELSKRITCGPFGSTLMAYEHDPDGEVVLVQPTDISGGTFTFEPGWFVLENTLIKKKLPLYPPGCLLFARVGNPYCCVLPQRIKKATISSSMIAVEIDHEKADPYYVQAFFQSQIGYNLLLSIQKTTAQPTISTTELSNIRIPLPDINTQRAIGNKLLKAERLIEMSHKEMTSDEIYNVLSGNIDESSLITEKKNIDDWLDSNPSPFL